jgi:formylmethanofuran dehydrogenase subunit C
MSLSLRYHAKTSVPVEIEGVIPDRVRTQSLAEIEKLEIQHGNERLPLAELFTVTGDPSDGRIDFEGELAGVHDIGRGMSAGAIYVHGDAGRHVGGRMTGGRIEIDGNAGDWLGGEMHGGLIKVSGNAGDSIGAAYHGSKKGMTDGTILIRGDAGSEVGKLLRRGTLVIGGSCGDAPGFNMIAGSIVIFGTCGIRLGAGMRRGTIALFGTQPTKLLPTFRPAGRFRPLFLRLIFRELDRLDFHVDHRLLENALLLSHGDLVALGKGEVWMSGDS